MLLDILGFGVKLIDKLIPDPKAKAEAQLELLRLQQAGEFKALESEVQLALAQTDINKVEAASEDPFKGRWRPAVGWVCVAGLAYQFIAQPLLSWSSGIVGWPLPPVLNMGDLLTMLGGLLGLGAMRMKEKLSDKA